MALPVTGAGVSVDVRALAESFGATTATMTAAAAMANAAPITTSRLPDRGVSPPAAGPASGDLIDIPVTYDGEDLADVAAAWDTDEAGVIERLSGTELRVAFCGFSPGWGYLTGLPPQLAMPRLDTPRQRVPAGSVALGGEYVGIYPTASPGGWRLVGHTDVTLFDVTADPPALLTPGKRVRLVARVPAPVEVGR